MKSKLKKKKIIIGIAAVVVLVVAASAFALLSGEKAPPMSEVIAARQNLSTYYSFTGNIQAHDVQYVQSTSSEPVKKFYVREGDKVEAGALLYEVDSNSIQSSLTQARTSLSNANNEYAAAKLNYERMQALFDIGGVSMQELESAQKSYNSAQNQVTQATASMQQAQKQYEDTQRFAEISGEVSKIYVKENESITMGTSIMDIVDYDNLEVEIKIDEYDLATISEGMEAQVTIEALGKVLIGKISEIAREASVESGVSYFAATVVLPQDDSVRIGLTAEIRIVTQNAENVIAVPIAAVSYDNAGAYALSKGDDGSMIRKPVTVGINDGRFIEIKEGLSEGDAVLMSETAAAGGAQSQVMMMGPGPGGGGNAVIRSGPGGGGGNQGPGGGGGRTGGGSGGGM